MKKIVAVISAAFLSLGFAFADDAGERSVHWLGFNTPIENQNGQFTEDDEDIDFDIHAAGFNVFYNHLQVNDNRFTKIVDVQLGYEAMEFSDFSVYIPSQTISPAMKTFNTRWMFGLGGAPLNIDRVVLSVNGTFGVGMKFGTASESHSYADFDYTALTLNTFIGANVQCAVRLGDSFGLSAGMHMYTSLVGVGFYSWSYESKYSSYNDDDDIEFITITPGGFSIDFKFGVCWLL